MGDTSFVQRSQVKKMRAVRDSVGALVAHHFPSATPHHVDETHYAFGIDEHPRDGASSTRVFAPEPEINLPTFLHFSYTLRPDTLTQDASLDSLESSRQALLSDLNRLFTGNPEGETIAEGGERVVVGTSRNHPVGGLNIITYGTPEALHTNLKRNLERPDCKDLKSVIPNIESGANIS